jgi:hypothetical protein
MKTRDVCILSALIIAAAGLGVAPQPLQAQQGEWWEPVPGSATGDGISGATGQVVDVTSTAIAPDGSLTLPGDT